MAETPDEMRARRAQESDFHVNRSQDFDVVMRRKGVNTWEATEEDYKRVNVRAESTTLAVEHELVKAEEEFQVVQATAPGFRIEEEVEAQKRARAVERR